MGKLGGRGLVWLDTDDVYVVWLVITHSYPLHNMLYNPPKVKSRFPRQYRQTDTLTNPFSRSLREIQHYQYQIVYIYIYIHTVYTHTSMHHVSDEAILPKDHLFNPRAHH